MDEFKYVEYETADAVATITLARPEKANAQNERMLDELHHHFLAAEYDDDVKVVVLRGEGRHFSAGHDLGGGDPDPDAVSLAEPNGRRAVNQTLDVQGYYTALQSVFDVHHTGHGNAISVSGYPILMQLDEMKQNLKKQ